MTFGLVFSIALLVIGVRFLETAPLGHRLSIGGAAAGVFLAATVAAFVTLPALVG